MANKFFRPFLWVAIGCGSLAFVYSATQVSLAQLDSRFILLVAIALVLTSRITIPLPRLSSQISVSDTFVFLVLLLYGGPAAAIVGDLDTNNQQGAGVCLRQCRHLAHKAVNGDFPRRDLHDGAGALSFQLGPRRDRM